MRRIAKVNDLEIAEQFLPTMGVLRGLPAEGGAEKPANRRFDGFEARGKAFPPFFMRPE
jgi:hypothetical protein